MPQSQWRNAETPIHELETLTERKTMITTSLIQKSQTVLSVAFILATAGAFGISAQTTTENSSTSNSATATSTTKPKAIELKTPGVSASVDTASKSVPSASAKTTTSPETPVPQTVDQDKWQFQVTPYFWLASAHGTLGLVNRTATVDESFGDIFDTLNFFIMGTFEARKGKFISLTDLEYISISDEKATPGPFFSTVDAGFKTFIFDTEVGYRLLENSAKGASLDVLGGAQSGV